MQLFSRPDDQSTQRDMPYVVLQLMKNITLQKSPQRVITKICCPEMSFAIIDH